MKLETPREQNLFQFTTCLILVTFLVSGVATRGTPHVANIYHSSRGYSGPKPQGKLIHDPAGVTWDKEQALISEIKKALIVW